jgi:hypothetical protein
MAEKMTAVWLILLTILVCAAVPGVLIWLTSSPLPAGVLVWVDTLAHFPVYHILG